MIKTRILASVLLTAASLAAMPAAHAVVPGSDTEERARDGAAVQSVIEGGALERGGASAASSATYGFPVAAGARTGADLVPGSRSIDDAAERDAMMSVVNGTPGATYTAAPGGAGIIVPGSDSF